MKLEGVDIFVASTIGGAAKIPAELRYSVEVRLLRRRRQIADRHVLDHTAAKSADLSHRKLLSEGLGCEKPTILSDGRRLLRPPLNCRASGFVQSMLRLSRCSRINVARSSAQNSFATESGANRTKSPRARIDEIDPNVWSGRALQEVFIDLAVSGLVSGLRLERTWLT